MPDQLTSPVFFIIAYSVFSLFNKVAIVVRSVVGFARKKNAETSNCFDWERFPCSNCLNAQESVGDDAFLGHKFKPVVEHFQALKLVPQRNRKNWTQQNLQGSSETWLLFRKAAENQKKPTQTEETFMRWKPRSAHYSLQYRRMFSRKQVLSFSSRRCRRFFLISKVEADSVRRNERGGGQNVMQQKPKGLLSIYNNNL